MSIPLREGYRIPDLSEFVPGFEYEVHSEGLFEDSIEDFWGWYPYRFGEGFSRDLEEIEIQLQYGNIQVKIK